MDSLFHPHHQRPYLHILRPHAVRQDPGGTCEAYWESAV